MKPLADEDLGPLIGMVRDERGIDLAKYKEAYLRRRIAVRLRASKAGSLGGYLRLLRRDEREFRAFIDAVTINTSSFFRNPESFGILASVVLPAVAMMAALPGQVPPFMWSVGTALGEEAYSLAMLAAAFPPFAGAAAPPILATDIDESALEKARSGSYGERSLADLPPAMRERHFEREEGGWHLREDIRGMVAFARHDALLDELPGRFLLITCRNLIIYLAREAQEKLMMRLTAALVPGGYLMLGKTEILMGEARDCFSPLAPGERIYQKVDGFPDGCAEHASRRRA